MEITATLIGAGNYPMRRSGSVVGQQSVHLRGGVVGQQRSRKGRVGRCDGVAVCRDAQRVVAVGQRSRERSLQMQVANDVASAKELPSREARPAGALTTPPLPESCRAASSARIASRALWSVVSLAESAAFVAYEASSAASALEAWSAEMPVSRLASCCDEGLVARHCVSYLGVHLQWSVQPVHRGEQGGQRAGVLAEEGGVQGRRGDCV